RRAGYTLVPLRDVPASRRVAEFTELWSDTFKTHWGFTPFSEGEIALLAELQGPVGMLDLSLIAYEGTRPVGVLWVMPEISGIAALAPGHALAAAEKLNFLGIGVREAARGRGVNMAMASRSTMSSVTAATLRARSRARQAASIARASSAKPHQATKRL